MQLQKCMKPCDGIAKHKSAFDAMLTTSPRPVVTVIIAHSCSVHNTCAVTIPVAVTNSSNANERSLEPTAEML